MLTVNNTTEGYIQKLEIKGNTIQNSNNLADIRSVGDKVEGQELYEIPLLCCGKNLYNKATDTIGKGLLHTDGTLYNNTNRNTSDFIKVNTGQNIVLSHTGFTVCFYDNNKVFVKSFLGTTFRIEQDGFIRITYDNTLNLNIQIEEGTVATPYESYQEHKLTILSPVQIEKVGDVADRIIEKDGVWGVEKNVDSVILNGSEGISKSSTGYFVITTPPSNIKADSAFICDRFKNLYVINNDNAIWSGNAEKIKIRKDSIATASEFKVWLQNNNTLAKYQTIKPTFIPLPHDQQVKLKTFANKTNISFLCEVEGTIKGEVPKSLGATVNTHTTQIDNLNKELDKIKKLEESTVSTVVTDRDFTVVEETGNGYFEDVKLEGKTLVNLYNPNSNSDFGVLTGGNTYDFDTDVLTLTGKSDWSNGFFKYNGLLKPSTRYLILVEVLENTLEGDNEIRVSTQLDGECVFNSTYPINTGIKGIYTFEATTIPDLSNVKYMLRTHLKPTTTGGYVKLKILVSEIQHATGINSYFGGLKSVGDGTDNIVVSSVNENLAKNHVFHEETVDNRSIKVDSIYTNKLNIYNPFAKVIKAVILSSGSWVRDIEVHPNSICEATLELNEYIRFINFPKRIWTDANFNYVSLAKSIIIGSNDLKLDKKQLLYYDPQDNTWKKPVLREWDTVEKHSDGKYYYHKRSAVKVLNGSEIDWSMPTNVPQPNTLAFVTTSTIGRKPTTLNIVCDKFNTVEVYNIDEEGIRGYTSSSNTLIRIAKSKLETQDVEGFKKWLQANNVTVVYQLAQEEVYECTNIDLITYQNQTNYLVESGVLCPRTTLKVHNNISNVVSLLQKKVSLLEQNVSKYMIRQDRLMLASRYGADRTDFKVDNTLSQQVSIDIAIDYDLFNLIKSNILVGKQNYDRLKIEEMMDFYVNIGAIDWDLWDELYALIEEQYTPPVAEEMPLVIK